jgi:hypothetical protein
VANAIAYYDTATITAVKSFIVQAPGNFRFCWQCGSLSRACIGSLSS